MANSWQRFGISSHSFRCSFDFRIEDDEQMRIKFRIALAVSVICLSSECLSVKQCYKVVQKTVLCGKLHFATVTRPLQVSTWLLLLLLNEVFALADPELMSTLSNNVEPYSDSSSMLPFPHGEVVC